METTLELARDESIPASHALPSTKTFAEFFAGIGLVRMGLERLGWSVSFANDIDPQKYQMYRSQFSDTDRHFLLDDIHSISAQVVPDVLLATACFPCNDLSLAGSRSGLYHGKQSSAFWGFIRILRDLGGRRPPLVLLENVTGFLTSNKGEDFKGALLALNDLGYAVDAFILDAARFVPQSRQRLFVVGSQENCFKSPNVQNRLLRPNDSRPEALTHFISSHPQIRWGIQHLPPQPGREFTLEDVLEDLPETAPEWWNRERATYLLSQMSSRHREIAERMIANAEWSYGTVFRRVRNGKSMAELRTDGLAGCLRTPRGGSGRQILFKAGQEKYFARLLTPRECARLMGASDYAISVPLNQSLFGFGDAVCVPVVEWIAKHYLNPLADILTSTYLFQNNCRESVDYEGEGKGTGSLWSLV